MKAGTLEPGINGVAGINGASGFFAQKINGLGGIEGVGGIFAENR